MGDKGTVAYGEANDNGVFGSFEELGIEVGDLLLLNALGEGGVDVMADGVGEYGESSAVFFVSGKREVICLFFLLSCVMCVGWSMICRGGRC